MKTLQQFLSWLADTKPGIFSGYQRNFTESEVDGITPATTSMYRISTDEFKMLAKIANDWFHRAA